MREDESESFVDRAIRRAWASRGSRLPRQILCGPCPKCGSTGVRWIADRITEGACPICEARLCIIAPPAED